MNELNLILQLWFLDKEVIILTSLRTSLHHILSTANLFSNATTLFNDKWTPAVANAPHTHTQSPQWTAPNSPCTCCTTRSTQPVRPSAPHPPPPPPPPRTRSRPAPPAPATPTCSSSGSSTSRSSSAPAATHSRPCSAVWRSRRPWSAKPTWLFCSTPDTCVASPTSSAVAVAEMGN